MTFTSSIQAFGALSRQDALVDSYRMLIALELALKDAKCGVVGSGHDIPSMLTLAAHLPASNAVPYVSAQLLGYSATLKADLVSIICEGKSGSPSAVPAHNYPYIRYTRRVGDWGGTNETPVAALAALEVTCHRITQFLSVHGAKIGVFL